MLSALFIAMLTAITVWWLLIQRLKDKPWMKQGVVPTSQETVTSSAPKVGLWVFLAVVSSLFGLFASAYMMRMGGHGGLVSWQALDEPSVLWINTLVLVLASGAMQVARNRIDADDFTGGRSYFLAAGLLTVVFLVGPSVRLAAGARGRQFGPGQPGVRLLRAADGRARPAPDRRPLGARPHDGAHFPRRRRKQRRRAQPHPVERAAVHDVLALAAADLARRLRIAVVDLNPRNLVRYGAFGNCIRRLERAGLANDRHRLVRRQADVPGSLGQSDDVDLPAERHVHLHVLPHGLHERPGVDARAVAEPERSVRARGVRRQRAAAPDRHHDVRPDHEQRHDGARRQLRLSPRPRPRGRA